MPVLKSLDVFSKNYFKRFNLILCAISPKMKAFLPARHKSRFRNASLTTEAALVFPVFFFAVYMLWHLFLVLLFQVEVCRSISETAMKYSHLGYPERKAEEQDVDISWLYQPILWTALPESDKAENIWLLCVPEEEGAIRVKVNYQYVCEAPFFQKFSLSVQQSFRFYPYVGETDADLLSTEKEADVVYVTEYGTVYHESRACGYLNVVVRSVKADQITEERNSSGRRYSLCERCDAEEMSEKVYVSAGGEKYHLIAGCPALKRTISEKSREEVEGMPACHKCGNRKGAEAE